jgi:nucleotide-binding universal stress UspA family protein
MVYPAEQIIHFAETTQGNLIVMGMRSQTILPLWMIGSNSERILKFAHCPILIARRHVAFDDGISNSHAVAIQV